MQPDACWLVRLGCGHEARLRHAPRAGGWITCVEGRCQGQRRVAAVEPVPVVMVMDPLFGLEACRGPVRAGRRRIIVVEDWVEVTEP